MRAAAVESTQADKDGARNPQSSQLESGRLHNLFSRRWYCIESGNCSRLHVLCCQQVHEGSRSSSPLVVTAQQFSPPVLGSPIDPLRAPPTRSIGGSDSTSSTSTSEPALSLLRQIAIWTGAVRHKALLCLRIWTRRTKKLCLRPPGRHPDRLRPTRPALITKGPWKTKALHHHVVTPDSRVPESCLTVTKEKRPQITTQALSTGARDGRLCVHHRLNKLANTL